MKEFVLVLVVRQRIATVFEGFFYKLPHMRLQIRGLIIRRRRGYADF